MRWVLGSLLGGIAVLAVAAYAVGAGKSSSEVTLCASKKSGAVSLASKAGRCGKGSKKLTIAKEEAPGPVGPQGPGGATGAPGVDATAIVESAHYIAEPATDTCFETPTFCRDSGSVLGWENFGSPIGTELERVGFYKDAGGVVHLFGAAVFGSIGGGGGGFQAEGPFYLPPGYRPASAEDFLAPYGTEPGEIRSVLVKPNGAVVVSTNTNYGVSLSGISFRAAGP